MFFPCDIFSLLEHLVYVELYGFSLLSTYRVMLSCDAELNPGSTRATTQLQITLLLQTYRNILNLINGSARRHYIS